LLYHQRLAHARRPSRARGARAWQQQQQQQQQQHAAPLT